MKQAYEAIRQAQLHSHLGAMSSSAVACLQDAEALFNKGDFASAYSRAKASLMYSVGILSHIYKKT